MKKLIVGILLIVAALVAPLLLLFPLFGGFWEEMFVLEAPGRWTMDVEEPGRHYIWNEYETIHEGTTYSASETLPAGITFSLADSEDGEPLAFVGDGAISVSSGAAKKNSIGYFEIEEPGAYVLEIQGLEMERLFSFSPSVFGSFGAFFGRIALGFLLAAVFGIAGFLFIILGIIEWARKEKKLKGDEVVH